MYAILVRVAYFFSEALLVMGVGLVPLLSSPPIALNGAWDTDAWLTRVAHLTPTKSGHADSGGTQ